MPWGFSCLILFLSQVSGDDTVLRIDNNNDFTSGLSFMGGSVRIRRDSDNKLQFGIGFTSLPADSTRGMLEVSVFPDRKAQHDFLLNPSILHCNVWVENSHPSLPPPPRSMEEFVQEKVFLGLM